MDFNAVQETLLAVRGVEAVHSLHIWALTAAQPLLSVHIAISECHTGGTGRTGPLFSVHIATSVTTGGTGMSGSLLLVHIAVSECQNRGQGCQGHCSLCAWPSVSPRGGQGCQSPALGHQ